MIDPGKMSDRIRLQKRVMVEVDRGGWFEYIEAWQDIGKVWAQFRPTGGREFRDGVLPVGETRGTFTIHYRKDLSQVDRLVFEGKIWDIKSLGRVGFKEALDINATTIGTAYVTEPPA